MSHAEAEAGIEPTAAETTGTEGLTTTAAPSGVLVVPIDPWFEVPRRVLEMVREVREALERLLDTGAALADVEPTSEAEAIHDFRVALRRLRSVLKPLRVTSGRKPMRELEGRLRVIAGTTGELRDEEVLRETLTELELDPEIRRALDRWMRGRRRRETGLRGRVLRSLGALRSAPWPEGLGATLDRVAQRIEGPPKRLLGDRAFTERTLREAYASVLERAAGAQIAGDDALHRLRIALKRLRYCAEVFGSRSAVDARTIEKRSARLQKLLGRVHDLDEAERRMSRAWGLDAVSRATVLAALDAARRATLARSAREVPRELQGIAKAMAPLT